MPIKLNNVSKNYGNNIIFQNLNFEFKENNIYIFTGTIGSGKTTLLNMLATCTSLTTGHIDGLNNKKISYLFQDNYILDHFNVYNNLKFVLENNLDKNLIDDTIVKYLKLFGLYEYSKSNINKLSGGMQKKLAIARTVAIPNFNVLLLDEPFSSIDQKESENILKIIMSLIPKDCITIICSHNIKPFENFTDVVYELNAKPIKEITIKSISSILNEIKL